MNSLSLFLYATSMLTNLSVLLTILLTITTLSGFVIVVNHGIFENKIHPRWWVFPAIAIPMALILVFIPSKDTMYMIAASQVGEQVIQLEEVKSIGGEVGGLASDTIELLRQNIQDQLTQKPVEGSK